MKIPPAEINLTNWEPILDFEGKLYTNDCVEFIKGYSYYCGEKIELRGIFVSSNLIYKDRKEEILYRFNGFSQTEDRPVYYIHKDVLREKTRC